MPIYNLLIVDDEKSVVESMANDIPWEDLDVSDVSVAYSGRQALDIIEGKRIDILLSDINMPDLDGIHLSEQIHLRFQHTKIIFLTGYDRFDYAMQAIQHGVFAYLLKPVTNKELLDTVQHALEALQEEIEKTAAYSRVEQQYIDALPLLQNRFFIEWIVEGRFNTTDAVASQLHELHMDLSVDSPYILMLLKVDELRADDVLDDRQQIALQNMVSDTLLQNHKSMIFKITQNTYGIILPVSSEHDGLDIIRRTKDMWSIFLKFVQYTIRYPVSLFVMDQTASVLTLNGCYKALRSQMNRYLPLRSGMLNVLRPSELADIYDAIAALNDYPGYYDLANALDMQASTRLENVFAQLHKRNNCTRVQLLELYLLISEYVLSLTKNRGFSLADWAGSDEAYFFNFEQFSSVEDLEKWCIRVTDSFISFAKNNVAERVSTVVNNTMQRIRKDISENFSVVDLAQEQFISPSHLTRVFKKELGMSVQDYIIQEKIKAAKYMLKVPGTKVYEVVNALGYTSISHFNRLFKRETGISPKEYQSHP